MHNNVISIYTYGYIQNIVKNNKDSLQVNVYLYNITDNFESFPCQTS